MIAVAAPLPLRKMDPSYRWGEFDTKHTSFLIYYHRKSVCLALPRQATTAYAQRHAFGGFITILRLNS